MRLAFAGTPATAADTLRALLGTHHTVEFALTRPDAPSGRGRVMTASPVADLAEQSGVRLIKTASLEGLDDSVAAVDCVVVVAYGCLVPEGLLTLPRFGFVNVHYSLLPRWRGAAPVQHAIAAGDERSGVSVFRLDAGVDTGPVLATREEPIGPRDTSGSLLTRLTGVGADLLLATLDDMEQGRSRAIAQPADGATMAPKVTTAQARVDWASDAVTIDRRIRAMTPAPGAWCMSGDDRVKLDPVTLRPAAPTLAPGEVAVISGEVLVGTATHPVELHRVQRAGRTPVAATAWAATRDADLA